MPQKKKFMKYLLHVFHNLCIIKLHNEVAMKKRNNYIFALDIIRILACLAILFYHLNILKGGYLAVCTFLVLSGYLSVISLNKNEKVSLKDYYIERLKEIYVPLLIVVFLTIAFLQIIPKGIWLNLKAEVTSVILGYNNFWQISANLDYFAHHISSPFMHLWYIAILLQFEVVFPFIYLLFKKIGEKVNKKIPSITFLILTIGGFALFYYSYFNQNLMVTYYSTLTRVFSLFLGVALGFVHIYFKPLILKNIKKLRDKKIIFYSYLILLTLLFIFIPSSSKLMPIAMLLSSIITCRLIDYAIVIKPNKLNKGMLLIKNTALLCYEIYLWQYPLIYVMDLLGVSKIIKVIGVIVLSWGLSFIIHFALNLKKVKCIILRWIVLVMLLIGSLFGCYNYLISEDHTKEMNSLEKQLSENAKMLEIKQKEYEEKMQQEEDALATSLKDLDISEEELKLKVTNLRIVGIGDSVMLGAVNNLYETFPNGYFDAKISRTAWVVNDILIDLNNRHLLGEPILINLGANGDCPDDCKAKIMETIGSRDVFWLNVTNDNEVHFNAKLANLAQKYTNIHIIDWASISEGHSEYFVADGIHLTKEGREAYTNAIYDTIYQTYLDKNNKQKEEIINDYETKLKNKITFIGNDLLLNAFDYLKEDYPDALFEINKDFNYETLNNLLMDKQRQDTLTAKIVFVFDKSANLDYEKWQKIIEIVKDKDIYVITYDNEITEKLNDLKMDNIKILPLENNEENIMADGIHLAEKGNEKLQKLLKENIN